jgi:hypothetical protein
VDEKNKKIRRKRGVSICSVFNALMKKYVPLTRGRYWGNDEGKKGNQLNIGQNHACGIKIDVCV